MRLHMRLKGKNMVKKQVNTFLADKKAEIGSLISVKCSLVRFSKYEIKVLPELHLEYAGHEVTKNNVGIITGIPPVITNDNPEFVYGYPINTQHTYTFNRDTLFEVLSITKGVDITRHFDRQNQFAIGVAAILNLCKKYGIPATNGPIWKQHKIEGFEITNFQYKLYKLHWRFAVYMAFCNEDYNLIRELVNTMSFGYPQNPSNDVLLSAAKDWLIEELGYINIKLCSNSVGFGLEAHATDIIGACNMLLSMMMTTGEGKNVKICPNCGDFFTGHGNKKWCPKCNRKTISSRKKRGEQRKQKEAFN